MFPDKSLKDYFKQTDETERLLDEHHNMLSNLFLYHELQPNSFFSDVKELSYQLITFVDNICKKYDLQWWSFYGTLLGAVRHNDFVPWDDDLDIGMMRADYNKFYDVLDDEIKENNLKYLTYYFKHKSRGVETNKRRWLQVKYIHEDYRFAFASIDIFPFDYLKKYPGDDLEKNYLNARKTFFKEGMIPVDIDIMLEHYYDTVGLTFDKSEYFIPGLDGVHGPRNMFPLRVSNTDDLFPLRRIDFGNIEVNIPKNYDDYLKSFYGDYMSVPNSVRNHSRMRRFMKVENRHELLEEAINMFKDANDNF